MHEAIGKKKVPAVTKELSELGVHVSTRLNILPRIFRRLNSETALLHEAARGHRPDHVFTSGSCGFAFQVDDDLKYELIADIDAILFEINSCAELMQRFFELLHAHAGNGISPDKVTTALRRVLAAAGVKSEWFVLLDRSRNFFVHEGAPYLAIDVTTEGEWGILVMKENLSDFGDETKFFRFSDIQLVATGFSGAKAALQRHLIDLFRSL